MSRTVAIVMGFLSEGVSLILPKGAAAHQRFAGYREYPSKPS